MISSTMSVSALLFIKTTKIIAVRHVDLAREPGSRARGILASRDAPHTQHLDVTCARAVDRERT